MDRRELKRAGTGVLPQEIATRSTDPKFFAALNFLPNPDPVLRKLGRSYDAFDAISSDAHVLGELRSIRSGLLSFEWQLQPGGDQPADLQALELCEQVFNRRPAPLLQWSDVIWNMAQALFHGHAVHEVVWARQDRYLVPTKVIDRPPRRFVFSPDNELRLRTRERPVEGIELGAYKWLLTRHMASHDNPYGVAIYSSCFWPYTFKHSGFRYFVKFCEKYGIPWPIGKYPQGTPRDQQQELADRLADMVEDAVAVIPDSGSVDLLETTHSGQLVHERLIDVCNREMSKALTSQTLATEIQGQGSRAASETHRGREQSVNESDRAVICDAMNELCAWITELNVPGATPPYFEFYEEAEARKDWAEVLDRARGFLDIPRRFAHERLQIPLPDKDDELLPRAAAPQSPFQFNRQQCPGCGTAHEFAADADPVAPLREQAVSEADQLLDGLIAPVRELLDQAKTLEEFRDGLAEIYPDIDETRLGEFTSLALMAGFLQGMDEA